MFWALNENEKVRAIPNIKAVCPICKGQVIPKCGRIKIWHWAHQNNFECDSWSEPESEWHINWKNEFPKEQQEFTMGAHRADIRTSDRWIIELQNSSISPEEIIERENYYKRMIWLINGVTFAKGLELRFKNELVTFRWKNPPKSWWYAKKDIYVDLSNTIKNLAKELSEFKNGKTTSAPISEVVYNEYTQESWYVSAGCVDTTKLEIDKLKKQLKELSKGTIFQIKKIHNNIPCGGWGILLSRDEFLNKFRSNGG